MFAPGWADDDRAWALALAEREATQCPRGHDLTESLDERWLWQPNKPAVCLACLALHEDIRAHEKDPQHRAMLHTVSKVPRAEVRKGAAKIGASPHQKPKKSGG